MFFDRIYSVEARSGLDPKAGTVLWRFDANDYPVTGGGMSYTDPRGRVWNINTAGAIIPKVPAVPAVPGGWSWEHSCHVHGIAHSIRPQGADNRVAGWDCRLRLVDASFWDQAEAWDYSVWDDAEWAGPARRQLELEEEVV